MDQRSVKGTKTFHTTATQCERQLPSYFGIFLQFQSARVCDLLAGHVRVADKQSVFCALTIELVFNEIAQSGEYVISSGCFRCGRSFVHNNLDCGRERKATEWQRSKWKESFNQISGICQQVNGKCLGPRTKWLWPDEDSRSQGRATINQWKSLPPLPDQWTIKQILF